MDYSFGLGPGDASIRASCLSLGSFYEKWVWVSSHSKVRTGSQQGVNYDKVLNGENFVPKPQLVVAGLGL